MACRTNDTTAGNHDAGEAKVATITDDLVLLLSINVFSLNTLVSSCP